MERYIVLEERKSGSAKYTKLPSLFNQIHCKRIDQKILIERTNVNFSLALKIIMGHIKNLQLQFFFIRDCISVIAYPYGTNFISII